MGGVIPKFTRGPVTYEVVESVKGGLLVEARAASKVGLAAAGSTKCLGVATTDARPTNPAATTDEFGNQVLTEVNIDQYTAVGSNGEIYPVEYAANAAFGDLLKCAAAGKVTPLVVGTDNTALVVGRCVEPAGVVIATKAIGLAKITV